MINPNVLLFQLEKSLKNESLCVLCNKKSIGSHSIQNGYILDQLESDGHVWVPDSHNPTSLKKIGRNNAQIFYSLCNFHDTELFKEIDFKDSSDLESLSKNQQVALIKRSTLNEEYKKKYFKKLLNEMITLDNPLISRIFNNDQLNQAKMLKNYYISHLNQSIQGEKDIIHTKNCIKNYEDGKSDGFLSKIYFVKCSPSFSCSSYFTVSIGLNNNIFFDMKDLSKNPPWMSSTVIPIKNHNKTLIILSYHKDFRKIFEKNIFYKLDDIYKTNEYEFKLELSNFLLNHIENFIFSDWVQGSIGTEIAKSIYSSILNSNTKNEINLFQD